MQAQPQRQGDAQISYGHRMGKHAGLAVMREIFRALHVGMGEYIPAIARNLFNDPRAGHKRRHGGASPFL